MKYSHIIERAKYSANADECSLRELGSDYRAPEER